MKHSIVFSHGFRRLVLPLCLALLLQLVAACSNKGVHMPTHRKRRNCDCPTFSYTQPRTAEWPTIV